MGMKRRPEVLEAAEHDLLIIGGGITGACLAFDAATRGMRVALIEREDFGGATSAASSKLLHGGIRYLQQLRLGKARESARERLFFQNLAPHLTRYVPFVVPTFRGLAKSKPVLSAGMMLYEALCIGQTELLLDRDRAVPPGRELSVADVTAMVPGIEGEELTGELSPDEVRIERLHYVEPRPYTREEFEASYRWMQERGMIAAGGRYENLVTTVS